MNKKGFLVYLIVFLFGFFLVDAEGVKASDIVIEEGPTASDIIYGHPLFSSTLSGGVSSVEGTFSWKNRDKVLDAGTQKEQVIFVSNTGESVEMDVDINVLPRRVYLKFEEELRKQYNGNDKLEAPSYIVGGIIDSSVYVSGDISLTLKSVFVGENIDVDIQGLELKGDKKENYYLDLSGFSASIHPRYLEKFGVDKNRVDFSSGVYIPINSTFQIEEVLDEIEVENHQVKKIYDLKIVHNGKIVDVKEKINVKLKIQEDMRYKRIKLYNLYNGSYQQLEYSYESGFLVYSCNGLGKLVIVTEDYNFVWVYIVGSFVVCSAFLFIIIKVAKKRNKINRYKSLKRRKDYGNY